MKNKNNSKQNFYPAALTITGSDSSGGAGVQVDLRTFNAFAVYGCSAITAIASRSSVVMPICCEAIETQINAVLAETPIKFAKSGMLLSADMVRVVAEKVAMHQLNLVADPSIITNYGTYLLNREIIEAMDEYLFPLAKLITVNIPEAEIMLGAKINNEKDLISTALRMAKIYKTDVIIKGGHWQNNADTIDIVVLDGDAYRLKSPYLKNCRHNHGADCTFSAAICANLALGTPLDDSILEAKTFVFGSLVEPVRIGNSCEVMYPPELDYSEHVSLIGI